MSHGALVSVFQVSFENETDLVRTINKSIQNRKSPVDWIGDAGVVKLAAQIWKLRFCNKRHSDKLSGDTELDSSNIWIFLYKTDSMLWDIIAL